ncbi:basic proline-rich protein-like [Lutra lutra]|uniref:basic proline-rich protein-like n=1 Tax=Lutra lutra TaxID=9657 RepID=UPI001FD1CB25|nr:basic proline-rich protein-like [Lutra lutra]
MPPGKHAASSAYRPNGGTAKNLARGQLLGPQQTKINAPHMALYGVALLQENSETHCVAGVPPPAPAQQHPCPVLPSHRKQHCTVPGDVAHRTRGFLPAPPWEEPPQKGAGKRGGYRTFPCPQVRVRRASTVRAWTRVPSSRGRSSAAGKPPPAPRCCGARGCRPAAPGSAGERTPAVRVPLLRKRSQTTGSLPRRPQRAAASPGSAAAQGSAAGSACGLCAQTRPPRGRQPTPGAPAQRRPLPPGVGTPGRAARTPAIPRAVARSCPHMSRPREPPRTGRSSASPAPPATAGGLAPPGPARPHHGQRGLSRRPALERCPPGEPRCPPRAQRPVLHQDRAEAGAAAASTTRRAASAPALGSLHALPPGAPVGLPEPLLPAAPAPSASPGAALSFPPAQAPGLWPHPAAVVLGRTSAGGGERGRGSPAAPAAAPAHVHRRSLARPAPARSLGRPRSHGPAPRADPCPASRRPAAACRPRPARADRCCRAPRLPKPPRGSDSRRPALLAPGTSETYGLIGRPDGIFVETRECPAPNSAARPCLSDPPAALRVGPWNSRASAHWATHQAHAAGDTCPGQYMCVRLPPPSGVRYPPYQGRDSARSLVARASNGTSRRPKQRPTGFTRPWGWRLPTKRPASPGTAPHQAAAPASVRSACPGARVPHGPSRTREAWLRLRGHRAPGSSSASRPTPRAGHGAPHRPSKLRPRLAMQNFTPAGCVHSGSPVPPHKSPQAPVAWLEEHPRGQNSGRDASPTAAAALGLSSQCRRDTNTLSGKGP